MKICFFFFW